MGYKSTSVFDFTAFGLSALVEAFSDIARLKYIGRSWDGRSRVILVYMEYKEKKGE